MSNETFSKALVGGGADDLLIDLGEMIIDSFLEPGLLKDIPLLGDLAKIFYTGKNVREFLFSRKVEKFLRNLPAVTEEEVNSFNDRIESDPKFKSRVAEHITLSLDRLDDIEKSEYLAKAFSGFIKSKIGFDQFRRIARAIERCMVDDLNEVHNFERANDAHAEITYDLAASGLIELVQLPTISGPGAKPLYKVTDFGELFVRIVLA